MPVASFSELFYVHVSDHDSNRLQKEELELDENSIQEIGWSPHGGFAPGIFVVCWLRAGPVQSRALLCTNRTSARRPSHSQTR